MSFSSDWTIFYFINSTCTCNPLWFSLLALGLSASSINKNPFNWSKRKKKVYLYIYSYNHKFSMLFNTCTNASFPTFTLFMIITIMKHGPGLGIFVLLRNDSIDSTATNFGLWWIRRRNTAKYRLISCCLENLFSELSWGKHYTMVGTGTHVQCPKEIVVSYYFLLLW